MALSSKTAQDFVPIEEIRNGTVIMNDGSMRGVVLCSSINFALKSNEERAAVLSQFQDFLNSLDFSVQITVQSRRLDIKPYLELLSQREDKQATDLMKIQVREYMGFIKELTDKINIMTKNFFVIIPYQPAAIGGGKKGLFNKSSSFDEENATFEQNKSQLDERVSFIMQGLQRTGVRTARLDTEELIELYYRTFNPGESETPAKR